MKKYIQALVFCLFCTPVFSQNSGLQIPFLENFNYQSGADFYTNWDSSGVEIVKLVDASAAYGIRFNGIKFNKTRYSDSLSVDSTVSIKTDSLVSKTINSSILNSKKSVNVEFVWQGGGFGASTQPISQNGERLILYVKNNGGDTVRLWRSPDSGEFDKLKFYKVSIPLEDYITFPTNSLEFMFLRIGPSTTNTSVWFVTSFGIGYTNGLPLWDDFSNADSYRRHFKSNTGVYINNHLAVSQPSINVATFDGIDDIGKPYYDISETEMGMADSLVSWPIDISDTTAGLSPKDSLRFAFFYQKKGLGEEADLLEGDSLVLLFYNKNKQWKSVWHSSFTEAIDPNKFYQVLLTVKDSSYFHKDFKFKFFNYCRLSGAFDMWHIDYLTLDTIQANSGSSIRRIVNGKIVYSDLAISSLPPSITGPYKSIPVNHLSSANFNLTAANNYFVFSLAEGENGINPKVKIYRPGLSEDTLQFALNIPVTPGVNTLTQSYLTLNNLKASFPAIPNKDDTLAFKIISKLDIGFGNSSNFGDYLFRNNDIDSSVFTFDNYYAYDDGTYEIGEMLKQTKSKQALGFDFYGSGEDILTHIDICLPHVGYNIQDNPFLLKVWDDLNGRPGKELYTKREFVLHKNGRNSFTRYKLNKTVLIKGRFYIGYQQYDGSTESIKIGYDLSSDNKDQLWYDNNQGRGWSQFLNVNGNLMIRPVFEKNAVNNAPLAEVETEFNMVIYPNPSSVSVSIKDGEMGENVIMDWIEITDQNLKRWVLEYNTDKVDVSFLATGYYIIRGLKDGNIYNEKLIIEGK